MKRINAIITSFCALSLFVAIQPALAGHGVNIDVIEKGTPANRQAEHIESLEDAGKGATLNQVTNGQGLGNLGSKVDLITAETAMQNAVSNSISAEAVQAQAAEWGAIEAAEAFQQVVEAKKTGNLSILKQSIVDLFLAIRFSPVVQTIVNPKMILDAIYNWQEAALNNLQNFLLEIRALVMGQNMSPALATAQVLGENEDEFQERCRY